MAYLGSDIATDEENDLAHPTTNPIITGLKDLFTGFGQALTAPTSAAGGVESFWSKLGSAIKKVVKPSTGVAQTPPTPAGVSPGLMDQKIAGFPLPVVVLGAVGVAYYMKKRKKRR